MNYMLKHRKMKKNFKFIIKQKKLIKYYLNQKLVLKLKLVGISLKNIDQIINKNYKVKLTYY